MTLASSPVLAAALVAAALVAPLAHAEDGVLQVKVGAVIERSIDQVKAANCAWGPKQDIDATTGETHVYLPYGSDSKLYWKVDGSLSDAKVGASAEFYSTSSNIPASLTYKLAFDKPIKSFRCQVNYAEQVMAPSCVAGLEYSLDGKAWKTVFEHPKGTRAVTAPLIPNSNTIVGLDTKALFLRIYARDGANPIATSGPEMYLKVRISGDPGWGDAATTFAQSQSQVWVTAK